MMSDNQLFKNFEPVSSKAWKQKIQVDLKGADYNETLLWDSPEGIRVKPFYTSEDVESSTAESRSSKQSFQIGERIVVVDSVTANQKCKNALSHGVESLILEITDPAISLNSILQGIDLEDRTLYLDLESIAPDQIPGMLENLDPKGARIYILSDVIGQLAGSGNWFSNREGDFKMSEQLLSEKSEYSPVSVNVGRYQNAGANRVQQLAYALAHALEYKSLLVDFNVPEITFRLSVDTNYFFEIAKLRALRELWEKFSKEYGLSNSCRILVCPTNRNKTIYDYNVNMLRTTTECMSGILGGADTIYNAAYDHIYHNENEFAERIARNQLLILKNESYFDKVNNPAAGSYYIENLTTQLADQAWELFEQITAGGGFLSQLKEHKIQKKIKESAAKEQEAFDQGEEVLVGSNKYPNDKDRMNDQLDRDPFLRREERKTLIEPILGKRLAEKMEKKRLEDE